jgi:hypothetical protein
MSWLALVRELYARLSSRRADSPPASLRFVQAPAPPPSASTLLATTYGLAASPVSVVSATPAVESCLSCGWPTAEPYEIVSRHMTSEGLIMWTRCVCGRLEVRRGDSLLLRWTRAPADHCGSRSGPDIPPTNSRAELRRDRRDQLDPTRLAGG